MIFSFYINRWYYCFHYTEFDARGIPGWETNDHIRVVFPD